MKAHSANLETCKENGYVFGKLPPKVKKAWVKALETGEFKQGTDQLGYQTTPRSKKRYCCLGVACEVIPALKERATWQDDLSDLAPRTELHYGQNISDLTGYLDIVGLDGYAHNVLVELNDNGASFKEIAQWIRENL